jgi:acetyl esterase/lipase
VAIATGFIKLAKNIPMPTQSPVDQDRVPSAPEPPAGVTAHRDLAYVSNGHDRQKLDLYLPEQGENLPLLIWIHGGAFRLGSKEGNADNPLPFDYLAQGYALASINYRLSQQAIFPAQIEDCKAAVRWLRAHAARFHLDPNCFLAWGPSAGGHLVTMLGVTGQLSEFEVGQYLNVSSRVQAVVSYYGPTDFLQMDRQRLADGMLHDPPDSPESELIGGPIQEHQTKTARANPITYVSGAAPPFLIVHGDQDPLVPYGQSVILVEALQQAGVEVTFYTVKGAGHGHFTDPKVAELTKAFLMKHSGRK